MTLRRALIRALDRPGGRALLALAVNRLVRRAAPDVEVSFHRGMWVHREHGATFVDSPTLDYHPGDFCHWSHELSRLLAEAADHWLHFYHPQPGDIILDIGAGKGEDTIAFSRAVGPTGKVIAIEAHPDTFRCLRLFCEWNHLANVQPMHLAVTAGSGHVAIETGCAWQANRITGGPAKCTACVPGFPLDKLIAHANLTRIDFLKMNIEGAEADAIRGMQQTLRITRALCISCHDFRANQGHGEFFRTKAVVEQAVAQAGFRILPRDHDPRPYIADQVNAIRATIS
jgi:FkbM family methyltransferase